MPQTLQKTRKKKIPLYQSSPFLEELRSLFHDQASIPNAPALIEALKAFRNIPEKWTVNTVKTELTKSSALYYSRKKPAGYFLDEGRLAELIKLQNVILDSSSQSSHTPQANFPKPISVQRSKNKEKTESSKFVEDILDRIPKFPQYLLKRMSPQARKFLYMGVLEINSLNRKKIDQMLDVLSSSRTHYDNFYPKEQEIIKTLDIKLKYLVKLAEIKKEDEAKILLQKLFTLPLKKGKFQKIIDKWGPKYDLEECSYRCIQKMGRKSQKIPLSQFALRKHLKEILKETFPEK
ncbi:MAG: hypothetical protein ACTSVU_06595 [Promethearchaeota archaeon]